MMAMSRRERLERVIGSFDDKTVDAAVRRLVAKKPRFSALTDEAMEDLAEAIVNDCRHGYAASQGGAGALTLPSLGRWARVARMRAASAFERAQAQARAWRARA